MLSKVSEQIAHCYGRASASRAKASDAFNEASKQEFLDMEHRWMMLARSYELSDRVTDYINEAERRLHPAISHVRCPECGKRIRIATIEPDNALSGEYSFTCACGYMLGVLNEHVEP